MEGVGTIRLPIIFIVFDHPAKPDCHISKHNLCQRYMTHSHRFGDNLESNAANHCSKSIL